MIKCGILTNPKENIMRKKMEWQWEKIDETNFRARVIGGWILRTLDFDAKQKLLSCSTVFILDRDHEWYITKPKEEVEAVKPTVKATDFEPK